MKKSKAVVVLPFLSLFSVAQNKAMASRMSLEDSLWFNVYKSHLKFLVSISGNNHNEKQEEQKESESTMLMGVKDQKHHALFEKAFSEVEKEIEDEQRDVFYLLREKYLK
jgi:hypothetical protein